MKINHNWKKSFESVLAGVRKSRRLQCAIALCAALGWWGALYPELCLTPDTYRVINEETAAEEEEYSDAVELYWELLGADCGRIRFKSRLAELWAQYVRGK